MARTLPWNVDREQQAKKPRTIPVPRLKEEELSSQPNGTRYGDEQTTSSRGRAPSTHATSKSHQRTPSSSPIRGPPPVELMHEGYNKDDIFIMVEDEFQTVAQSYTAHLHHAEYKRLVKQARRAPPKALPEPTSRMSKRTMNRLRASALEKKQKESLHRVIALNSKDDEEDEDKVADLWSGTSLAPLMAGGSQQARSLVGLEGISSSTKAALGIIRSQSSQKDIGHAGDDRLDLNTTHDEAPLRPKQVANTLVSGARQHQSGRHQDSAELASTSHSIEQDALERRPAPANGKPLERPVTKRKFFFDLDDGFSPQETMTRSGNENVRKSKPAPLSNGTSVPRDKSEKEKEKSRLDEVPMWL